MKKSFRTLGQVVVCCGFMLTLSAGAQLLFAGEAAVSNTAGTLRAAVEDLVKALGDKYPRGQEFLDRLATLPAGDAGAFEQLQREALLANPLVSGRPILFICRPPYPNVHGPDETMYQSNEGNVRGAFCKGGALKILDAASGAVRTLVASTNGMVRDPAVHFDGKKVIFSMRHSVDDDYHLYEMDVDGGGLRQLTSAPNVSDIQPVYLPNGGVMFSSTREPKYIHCQRHLMASLFVMNGDGANIHQVGFNTLFEGRGSLMPDGRVLYSRWEYVDKHFSSAYGLWTVNPDGTAQTLFYGGLSWQPGAIFDGRIIPGTRKAVCVFGSVHGTESGAMVVVDPGKGNDGPETIVKSWPADIRPYMKTWKVVGHNGHYDSFIGIRPKYENPYPLSESYFLCSRTLSEKSSEMALFVVDVFGNEVLLHRESPGAFQPRVLAATERPPLIPAKVNFAVKEGLYYVYDVYRGEKMESVKRGTVKTLRIVEAPAKLTYPPDGIGDWTAPDFGESHHPVAMNWNHYNNKVILGTVPVEEDGSASFKVPAGRFLYFQLLDENGMMVHSMRSGTALLPGEQAGCVGCHDYRSAPASGNVPLALQRSPSEIKPWYGPERPFGYAAEVQPVLDKHCVKCHDYGKPAGKKLNLSGDLGLVFNASYCSLMARSPGQWALPAEGETRPLVSTVGSGSVPIVPPFSWGSHRSRLVDVLKSGHKKVELLREELDRIITWIDLDAPYYPDYPDYFTLNTFGRSPLDHAQLLELGRLVLAAPGGKAFGWMDVRAYIGGGVPPGSLMGKGDLPLPVNFTRPDYSACLQPFTDKSAPGYAEALALITKGKESLSDHPHSDLPGFKPCERDRERLEFHASRKAVELRTREAMARGLKVYDEDGGRK